MANEVTVEWLGRGPARLLWPDPEAGPFVVRLHWASVDGIGRLVGVDLRSVESDDHARVPQPVNTVPPNIGVNGPVPARKQVPVSDKFAEITVKVWRDFKFRAVSDERAKMLDEAQVLAQWEREYPTLATGALPRHEKEAGALGRKTPSKRDLADEDIRRAASAYKDAQERGDRKTLQAIQAALGGPIQCTRDQANYARKRAQELGYLPSPKRRSRSGDAATTGPV